MTGQLLIDLADHSPQSQLSLPKPDLAAPNLFSDQECETLWDRVNRIWRSVRFDAAGAWLCLSFGCANDVHPSRVLKS
jgi:hypothetical protein